jgi:hypothetical protein
MPQQKLDNLLMEGITGMVGVRFDASITIHNRGGLIRASSSGLKISCNMNSGFTIRSNYIKKTGKKLKWLSWLILAYF